MVIQFCYFISIQLISFTITEKYTSEQSTSYFLLSKFPVLKIYLSFIDLLDFESSQYMPLTSMTLDFYA